VCPRAMQNCARCPAWGITFLRRSGHLLLGGEQSSLTRTRSGSRRVWQAVRQVPYGRPALTSSLLPVPRDPRHGSILLFWILERWSASRERLDATTAPSYSIVERPPGANRLHLAVALPRPGCANFEAMELSPADRAAAIAVLERRLSKRALRAVVREQQSAGRRNRKSVEWIIAEAENRDGRLRSRLPDSELAPFLVDLRGGDLLCSRELRRQLADAADPVQLEELHNYRGTTTRGRRGRTSIVNAIAARRWQPGKAWPMHFVRTLALPIALAGIAGSRSAPAMLEVEPFRPLPALEDFQVELRDGLLQVLDAGIGSNRGILTLPTGAGKTRTATEALTDWCQAADGSNAILWIAQSEELCEQAVQAFREVWVDRGARNEGPRESLLIARLWGGGRRVKTDAAITVASIQKLHAIYRRDDVDNTRDELEELAERLGVVLIDEAHRMLAPTYSDVLGFLGIDLAKRGGSELPLVGLTATPYRGFEEETKRLASRFHGTLLRPGLLGKDPVGELRRRGVLSNPVHTVIESGGRAIALADDPRFAEHFERFNDFHPDLLRQLGQDAGRNRRLLDVLLAIPPDWPTLFFGCSVEHAQAVALLLRRAGRTADVVTSTTRPATRRHRIEEFRAGRLSALCNYGVLTTGFDAPLVRALVIGRPTASPVLYEQMIGRGMRGPLFGGTPECLVVDIEDNIRFGGQMAFARYTDYWSRTDPELRAVA
jgi:DNA repair protein RadD